MTELAFTEAYDRWQAEPFPKGSKVDALDELHADLAYVDAMVAECAVPYATEGRVTSLPTQALQDLDRILERSAELERDDDPENARLAASYRGYAERLKSVVDAMAAAQAG